MTSAGRPGSFAVDVGDDLVVPGDPARLRQLLVNLLDNAGRHAPAGTTCGSSGEAPTVGWWLEVADDGAGVAPEDRERVFDRFGTDGAGRHRPRPGHRPLGGRSSTAAPCASSTRPHGRGARLRLEVPADRHRPSHPRRRSPSMTTTAQPTTADPRRPAVPRHRRPPRPARSPGSTRSSGGFWPESGLPAGLPDGRRGRRSRAGRRRRPVLHRRRDHLDPGRGRRAVPPPCSRHAAAREPWTLLCTALALAAASCPMTLLDAGWIQVLGLVAAAAVFLCGVTGARTMPGIVLTGLAWPLASLRGLPWFGRSLRIAGTGSRTPALVRTVAWSLLGLGVFGTIFASANPVFGVVGRPARAQPRASTTSSAGPSSACFVFAATLGAAYLALNPADVEVLGERRPTPLANRFEWLVPVLVVDAVFLAFIAAQARALVGGRDYIEASTGLTYADYVHQGFGQLTLATALTVLVVWVASRRAGVTRRRPALAARLARAAVRADPARGRARPCAA